MLDEILEVTCWPGPKAQDDLPQVRGFQILAGQRADLSPVFTALEGLQRIDAHLMASGALPRLVDFSLPA